VNQVFMAVLNETDNGPHLLVAILLPDCFLGENPVNSRSLLFLIPVFSTHMIDFRIAISVICRIHGASRIFASTGRFSQQHGLDKL
jgi:hypothetical protein